jgi:hypothetical protein
MPNNSSTPRRSSPLKQSTSSDDASPPSPTQDKTTTTPPKITITPSDNNAPASERRIVFNGRPSILSQSRRNQAGNLVFGSARRINFPVNPVIMSHSPPVRTSGSLSPEDTPLRARSGSRSSSLPPIGTRTRTSSEESLTRSRSVKHLTCFWWKEKGSCKYSDEECLYAHHDTGKSFDIQERFRKT